MKTPIFTYLEYKRYLGDYLAEAPHQGHGLRQKWAKVMGCHTTYVSQVLTKDAQLSLEQALRLSRALKHSENEAKYFVSMVSYARSGTEELRSFFHKELFDMREQQLNLSRRLKDTGELTKIQQAKYYSAWYYAAVHMALAVPSMRSMEALGRSFGLTEAQLRDVLTCLRDLQIVAPEALELSRQNLHLDRTSEHVLRHHANWRLQALRAIEREDPDHFHYSSVVTMALHDLPRIKQIMIQAIEEIRGIVRASDEQGVYCYLLDLFPVSQD